jgi:hypothetical protein
MSLNQRAWGCSDVKFRLMRFGDAFVLWESVVTRNRRIALGSIPALCISLATVLRQHGTSWAPQLDVHPGSSVRLAAGLVDRPDTSYEITLALLAVTGTAVPRSVVPAARDLQRIK